MTWMMVPLAAAQAPLASSWRHGLHARLRALHRFAAAPRRHIPGKPRERSAMNQQGWWYHGDMNIYIYIEWGINGILMEHHNGKKWGILMDFNWIYNQLATNNVWDSSSSGKLNYMFYCPGVVVNLSPRTSCTIQSRKHRLTMCIPPMKQ